MRHWTQCFLRTRKTSSQKQFRRLSLTALEDRSVPTVFVVSTAADSGQGSLRQAIEDANANPGADSIHFMIQLPPNEQAIIPLLTSLPPLTDPVVIDATTEFGYAGIPRVVLDGTFARGTGGFPATGLTLVADGCGVFGLEIIHFTGDGISVQSSSNTISANDLGVNGYAGVRIWDGAAYNNVGLSSNGGGNRIHDNGHVGVDIRDPGTTNNFVANNTIEFNRDDGVAISGGAWFNTIGGTPVQSGNFSRSNVISGNGRYGISIFDPATAGNLLESNWLGLKDDGLSPLPNKAANIFVFNSPENTIGSPIPGMQNVISANKIVGIQIGGPLATGNVVEGNWIGTDATGTAALGNHIGISISKGASDTVVGGSTPGARNVICGNSRDGIDISNNIRIPFETTGNQVLGNWLGLGVNGRPLGSQAFGVWLNASSNQVGGPNSGDSNVISGNADCGILIFGALARGNRVQGNLIGTDPAGMAADGNGLNPNGTGLNLTAGVVLWPGAVDNLIGGTGANEGNVISGNAGDGILIQGAPVSLPEPTGNTIQGNSIGTDLGGTQPIANTANGIELARGAANNLIGGTGAGRNFISGNGASGIYIHDHPTAQNLVQGNYVGLDVNGNALGNTEEGVLVSSAGPANIIGGTATGAGNVISENGKNGVALYFFTDGTLVQGNRIGTNPDGSLPRGNKGSGVLLLANANSSVIGGTIPGAGNLISANAGDGIIIKGSFYNVLFGNDIGTDGTGTPVGNMGNGKNGIEIQGPGAVNEIGSPAVGAGNVIAGNTGSGVVMPAGSGNPIRGNSIFDNQGGNISLVSTGSVVATPVLNSVTLDANNHPVVQGTLTGTPNTTYYLEFFVSSTPEQAGSGETFVYCQRLRVVTGSDGSKSFTVEFPGQPGSFTGYLSATATDSGLNTSGFSNYVS